MTLWHNQYLKVCAKTDLQNSDFYKWQIKKSKEKNIQKLPKDLIGKFDHIDIQMHECFKNALLVSISDPKISYVEGWLLIHGVLVEHAWNRMKVGKQFIDFDLTEEKCLGIRKSVANSLRYFEIICLTSSETLVYCSEHMLSGPYKHRVYLEEKS